MDSGLYWNSAREDFKREILMKEIDLLEFVFNKEK